jgi:spore coat polysaccharide biosynthesis protein SpsF
MDVFAIIQARMGSTRLPGKVLKDISGETMLARVIYRVRRAKMVDEVIVATTDNQADEAVVTECERVEVPVFRGSEEDVLDRYYQTAKVYRATAIVRITSDCPLIEPEVVDRTVRAFLDEGSDYASNGLTPTYPRGLDTEVMTMSALARAWREANEPYQRAHVTPYIYQNPGLFRLLSVRAEGDHSDYRWTVDTPEDLAFVHRIYDYFGHDRFSWRDVLSVLEQNPQWLELNRHVRQKSVTEL